MAFECFGCFEFFVDFEARKREKREKSKRKEEKGEKSCFLICVFGLLVFEKAIPNYSTFFIFMKFLGSIVVSIAVCHMADRGSIPRLGVFFGFMKSEKRNE